VKEAVSEMGRYEERSEDAGGEGGKVRVKWGGEVDGAGSRQGVGREGGGGAG